MIIDKYLADYSYTSRAVSEITTEQVNAPELNMWHIVSLKISETESSPISLNIPQGLSVDTYILRDM